MIATVVDLEINFNHLIDSINTTFQSINNYENIIFNLIIKTSYCSKSNSLYIKLPLSVTPSNITFRITEKTEAKKVSLKFENHEFTDFKILDTEIFEDESNKKNLCALVYV